MKGLMRSLVKPTTKEAAVRGAPPNDWIVRTADIRPECSECLLPVTATNLEDGPALWNAHPGLSACMGRVGVVRGNLVVRGRGSI